MYEAPVQALIDELGRLPGIGPKSAQRLAFHLLAAERDEADRLAGAIVAAKDRVRSCERCFNVSDGEQCRVCRDARREDRVVCVVEDPRDLMAIERTREFRGRYHVLGGAISPIEGVGPDQLRIRELLERVEAEGVEEVVVATSTNVEGEATASYLAGVLKEAGVRVSRLASGLPVGGDLDHADEVTLGRAFAGRQQL